MKYRFILICILMFPVWAFAQQAKNSIAHLNQVLSFNDSMVNFSIDFPKFSAQSFRLNYLKKLVVSNQLTMPSNIKNQEQLYLGDVVMEEGPDEFEIFMAQNYYKGPFVLNIGNEKFHVNASLEEGTISSIDYIFPKNRNILRFIYQREAHQIVQFIFQMDGNSEMNKNENVLLYYNSIKESGGKDRGANLLNKEDVSNLATQIYLITEQLIFQYKACQIDYAYANWKKENIVFKTDSFLNTFNQSTAKDNYGNFYNTYFMNEKEVKIYTKVIVSPAAEKSVLFDFYHIETKAIQFNQNKIVDGLRKIILDELKYKIGSYSCFPSGAELRALFVISKGKLQELRD